MGVVRSFFTDGARTMYSLLLLATLMTAPQAEAAKGHLILVGGGTTPSEIVEKALALAKGKESRVLVIPHASGQPETTAGALKLWRDADVKEVTLLSLRDADKAVAAVRAADVIWIGGGDQSRLLTALEDTGVPAAIRERYAKGAVVGGTSAGASAVSSVVVTGEADLTNITTSATKTMTGLALWPEAIIDQHFSQRQRFNRLLSAVLDKPELLGVGIDESTGILVSGKQFEVFGKGNVLVIDARKARREKTAAGEPAAGGNLTLHVLKAGMKYQLEAAKP
jgi:cyanophycinase